MILGLLAFLSIHQVGFGLLAKQIRNAAAETYRGRFMPMVLASLRSIAGPEMQETSEHKIYDSLHPDKMYCLHNSCDPNLLL